MLSDLLLFQITMRNLSISKHRMRVRVKIRLELGFVLGFSLQIHADLQIVLSKITYTRY